ncbi:unnamed protein product [Polarella glacialis]|uniref:Pseudouridine synthase RsuA/RluA-like domain-containing protein n=1 Tax=Polarella glacialis TaxID=89957 RepID=A0A813IF46_POLGL|nr:unnamed protein product [Polarella glacialis]
MLFLGWTTRHPEFFPWGWERWGSQPPIGWKRSLLVAWFGWNTFACVRGYLLGPQGTRETFRHRCIQSSWMVDSINGRDDEQGTEGRELMLLRMRPLTGRTHQIGVRLASIGRPLLGDLSYGATEASVLRSCPQLFLHCRRIELRDLAGKPFVAGSTLPQELEEVFAQLQHVAKPGREERQGKGLLALNLLSLMPEASFIVGY